MWVNKYFVFFFSFADQGLHSQCPKQSPPKGWGMWWLSVTAECVLHSGLLLLLSLAAECFTWGMFSVRVLHLSLISWKTRITLLPPTHILPEPVQVHIHISILNKTPIFFNAQAVLLPHLILKIQVIPNLSPCFRSLKPFCVCASGDRDSTFLLL